MLTYLNPQMRTFIARQEMFFLSTADGHGECDVSFRAGEPGFVHVFNEKILVYAEYRGNGPAWATSPRTHTRGCSSSREADATLRARDARQGTPPLRRCSARLDLHGEILSIAGSEVLVRQLIAEIDPLFVRDRLPSSDPVERFLAHGVAELRLIRF
jgi:hypothetical protein